MRRIGRRLSGGSTKDHRRYLESKAASRIKELTEDVRGTRTGVACKYSLKAARSGTVALGKEAIGQPSQSISPVISIDEETVSWLCCSALSRVQIETQATNSHKKLTGRNVAINLLSGKRDINTAKIIQIRFALSHLGN